MAALTTRLPNLTNPVMVLKRFVPCPGTFGVLSTKMRFPFEKAALITYSLLQKTSAEHHQLQRIRDGQLER